MSEGCQWRSRAFRRVGPGISHTSRRLLCGYGAGNSGQQESVNCAKARFKMSGTFSHLFLRNNIYYSHHLLLTALLLTAPPLTASIPSFQRTTLYSLTRSARSPSQTHNQSFAIRERFRTPKWQRDQEVPVSPASSTPLPRKKVSVIENVRSL